MNYNNFLKELISNKQKYIKLTGKKGASNSDAEILALLDYIEKYHPDFLKNLEANILDLSNIPKRKALRLIKNQNNYKTARWIDPAGKKFIILKSQDGKFISLTPDNSDNNNYPLSKLLLHTLIKADLQNLLNPQQQELQPQQQEIPNNNTSPDSSFEAQFKKNILLFKNAAPSQVALVMLNNLPETELNTLNLSLSDRGITNKEDFEKLLDKWKDEALAPTNKKPFSRERNLSVSRERSL